MRSRLHERETPTALPGDVVVDGERVRRLPDRPSRRRRRAASVEAPIVPGHEIVGVVEQVGDSVQGFSLGERVGIPWLGYVCGTCTFCKSSRENLCPNARFTGYQLDGGYADYAVVDARYASKFSDSHSDKEAAPALVRRPDWLPRLPDDR